jgi:hypothetical protein
MCCALPLRRPTPNPPGRLRQDPHTSDRTLSRAISRPMGLDETATFARLKGLRREPIDPGGRPAQGPRYQDLVLTSRCSGIFGPITSARMDLIRSRVPSSSGAHQPRITGNVRRDDCREFALDG